MGKYAVRGISRARKHADGKTEVAERQRLRRLTYEGPTSSKTML